MGSSLSKVFDKASLGYTRYKDILIEPDYKKNDLFVVGTEAYAMPPQYDKIYNVTKLKKDEVYIFGYQLFYMPYALRHLNTLLKRAELILTLEDNWTDHDDGKAISEKTFLSMASFLIKYAKDIYSSIGDVIDMPSIYPSMKGSIDLDWEKDNYGMLMNIAAGGQYGTYYADDKQKKQMTEGSFNPLNFNINLLPKAIS